MKQDKIQEKEDTIRSYSEGTWLSFTRTDTVLDSPSATSEGYYSDYLSETTQRKFKAMMTDKKPRQTFADEFAILQATAYSA